MNRRPAPLPRGIEAFLPPAPVQTSSLTSVAVDQLEANPFQPRREMTGLDDLATSIGQHGILQPLVVRRHPDVADRYQIVAGERRWQAAQRVGLHVVPVTLRDLDDQAVAVFALVENLQREDLNAIDEAEGYARMLQEFAWTQDAVANAVGRSRSHVGNTLRLLNLLPEAITALREGRITAGHARVLLTHPAPAAALRQMLTTPISVRQAEASARPAPEPRPPRAIDPDIAALTAQLTEALGVPVTIVTSNGGGSLTMRFRAMEQLDGLIALLMPG